MLFPELVSLFNFNPEKIRKDFACLSKDQKKAPIYFDNACMTLKPNAVTEAIISYYNDHPSCHNRAAHEFGEVTTKKVHQAREQIDKYINCRPGESIVFTKNTTESINMIANMIDFKKGDVVLTTDLEHNSNMLPWQFLNIKKSVTFVQMPIAPDTEEFDLQEFQNILSKGKVKLVSIFHTSNITGIQLPIKEITKLAHENGAMVLLDAAQAIPHHQVDVQELDIDFMAFSLHKAYGPTGMGVMYAKEQYLNSWVPFFVGGEGITDTTYDSCTLSQAPEKFEVGLQNYAGIIGSGAAIKWLSKINLKKAHAHLIKLNEQLSEGLSSFDGLKLIGPSQAKNRSGIVNFSTGNRNPAEVCLMLSKMEKIMTRSGVHCGHSWFHKYDLMPTLRVSLAFYNTEAEVEIFLRKMRDLIK